MSYLSVDLYPTGHNKKGPNRFYSNWLGPLQVYKQVIMHMELGITHCRPIGD